MESVWDKAWRQARIRFPYLFWRKAWQLQKNCGKKSHLWGEIHQNLNLLSLNMPPEKLGLNDILNFGRGVTRPSNRLVFLAEPWTWQSAGASVVARLLSQGKGPVDRSYIPCPKWLGDVKWCAKPQNDPEMNRKQQVEVIVNSPKFTCIMCPKDVVWPLFPSNL